MSCFQHTISPDVAFVLIVNDKTLTPIVASAVNQSVEISHSEAFIHSAEFVEVPATRMESDRPTFEDLRLTFPLYETRPFDGSNSFCCPDKRKN